MLQDPNFPGSSWTPLRTLQRSPRPLADGEELAGPLPRTPPPLSPLGPRFYRSQGLEVFNLNLLRFDHTPKKKKNPLLSFVGFRRTEKMDSVMKELMGQRPPPPRIFVLEPPLATNTSERSSAGLTRILYL